MAPDTAAWHRTAPTDKTQQHTEAALSTVGLTTATQAGWLNDWMHSSGLTIKDSGEMEEEKEQSEVEGGGTGETATERYKAYKKRAISILS